jgi:NAD(P)-dependent dehydrogenase (short-subunit alcohol dehydrogenase family)
MRRYDAAKSGGTLVKRVAIVTGAARGIGEATARTLARDGCTVAVADRDMAGAQRVAGSLGDGHAAFEVDVVDERSVEALFADVEARLGPVAVLACVAGGPFLTPGKRPSILETTTDNWIRTEALNARAPFLCIRAMLRRRKDGAVADGRIVTVSSMSGITPESPTGPAYSAAKAAVIHLTRYAALEAAPMGITVNTVAPGLTDTPAVRGDLTAAQIEAARQAIPIGRLGTPNDIAETIAFLASPRAGYITGSVVEANGGRQPP